MNRYHFGILATHPIQYFSPWYRALARHPHIDLQVFYAHRQTPEGQASAGFGVPFDWDLPLLEGYAHQFLQNKARHPNVSRFWGCDTPEIASLIAKRRFDAFLVQGWNIRCFWQAMRACWKTGTPVMIRGDSQLPMNPSAMKRVLKRWSHTWMIRRFDAYLVVGERAREYLLYYGADRAKMFEVPHAVDNDFFAEAGRTFRPDRNLLRKNWGISENSFVLLFAGKLIAKKRPMDFLQAVEQARNECPSICGLVAGDGPMQTEMKAYVKDHRLPVQFTGFLNQKEIPKAYVVSDALVLPSEGSETWGLVVNEAMACGLPAIVSDQVGCGPDLVIPGRTGDTFPLGDTAALSAILKQFCLQPERAREMGEQARRKVNSYSVARAVEGTVAALEFIKSRVPAT